MKIKKTIIDHIEKCYAVTKICYDGESYLLCSAEGKGPCRSYTLQGDMIETLWDKPGGVMTLLQLPDYDEPVILATQGFFSPDNAAKARIAYYYRKDKQWHCETLCDMPFVHRFGVIGSQDKKYLIAATIKSDSAFEGDWSSPGKIWTAELPKNIFQYNEGKPLEFYPLMSGLYKNHGFSINHEEGIQYAIIGTENGVYTIYPPEEKGKKWVYRKILDEPVSDLLYQDFDNDGEKELLILSPFHGEKIKIFKKDKNGEFVKIYERSSPMPFAHAICGGNLYGKEYAFVGGREGKKELIAISFDEEKGNYTEELIDKGAGAANCMIFNMDNETKLLAANRESNEVAIYSF